MHQLTSAFSYRDVPVRLVLVDGSPWFVAKDVCEALELSDVSMSIKSLDDDEKLVQRLFVSGQTREVWTINESGLYSLILRSRKPEAREFKRWITHEVIPSIRQNGIYATDSLLDDPDLLLKTVTRLTEERRARLAAESKLVEQAPKVRAFETFISADGAQPMNEVAKALGWGRNKLFERLRNEDVLMSNNTPYQRFINAGYFVVKETTKVNGSYAMPFAVTLVTPKGVAFIERLLFGEVSA